MKIRLTINICMNFIFKLLVIYISLIICKKNSFVNLSK